MEQEVEKGREKRDVGVRHETEEAQEYNTNFEAEAQYEKEGVKESVREQEVLKVGGRNVKHERQHLKGCVGGGGGYEREHEGEKECEVANESDKKAEYEEKDAKELTKKDEQETLKKKSVSVRGLGTFAQGPEKEQTRQEDEQRRKAGAGHADRGEEGLQERGRGEVERGAVRHRREAGRHAEQ